MQSLSQLKTVVFFGGICLSVSAFGGVAESAGKWKLVRPTGSAPWELYDLEDDPSEQNDLAMEHRDVVAELAALAEASHVDMPQVEPDMPPNVRFRH